MNVNSMTGRAARALARHLLAALFGLAGAFPVLAVDAPAAPAPAAAAAPKLDNAGCLECHGTGKKIEVPGAEGKPRALLGVSHEKYAMGVHAAMACVDCHVNITDSQAQHRKTDAPGPACATCHERLWNATQAAGKAQERPRLRAVVQNAAAYDRSFHARKNADHPDQPNARCDQCHDTHSFDVPADRRSAAYTEWRRRVPALCAEACHDEQLESYNESVHGQQIEEKDDGKGAVCIDCHTTHEITNTSLASFKLLNPEECGSCHKDNLKTYRDTYHGQVTQLGDARAAKCYDCHGSHEIFAPDDKKSTVHPANRLKTCKGCHDGKKLPEATAGFATFGPHAHAGDFERYPQMWIASRFMVALLVGVFAFFWLHCGLWYYREWKDRKDGVARPQVRTADLRLDETRHVRRFGLGWRIAHLVFALVTMTLVLTGTTALFSESVWAPAVAQALGGAKNLGLIHRVAAALFIAIFFGHFVFVMYQLLVVKRATFRWFGPDSLIPNWKDFSDCWAMFKWFVGRGQRPAFDRWAYFEKFDYWAVFWGVNVIGWSGLMLAFPHITASYLPGWVFNVGTLVHGEEAFLAAVFLFTVHFFNNHFRPDKLPPPDIVMFTGSLSLEEFRRDHPAQYNRLVESGELEHYLVDAPSAPMRLGSKILGLALIAIGLILLVMVAVGFFANG